MTFLSHSRTFCIVRLSNSGSEAAGRRLDVLTNASQRSASRSGCRTEIKGEKAQTLLRVVRVKHATLRGEFVSAKWKKTKGAAFIAGCGSLSAFAMMLAALASFSQSVNQPLQLVGLGPPTRLGSAQTAPRAAAAPPFFAVVPPSS